MPQFIYPRTLEEPYGATQQNFDAISETLNQILEFIHTSTVGGAPSYAPGHPVILFKIGGTPGDAIWAYDGANWVNWA